MKTLRFIALLSLLLAATMSVRAESVPDSVSADAPKEQPSKKSKSEIKGKFIQRLGFTSGGFTQNIFLADLETGKIYVMGVKKLFTSAKENKFHKKLPPGEYAIVAYYYWEGKWYGGDLFAEFALKKTEDFGRLTKRLLRLLSSPPKRGSKLKKPEIECLKKYFYKFTLPADTVLDVGTWDFSEHHVPVFSGGVVVAE